MSRWKKGDTQPDMVIDCFDGDRTRAPLDEADLVKVIAYQRGVKKWERDVTPEAGGIVRMPLQPSDTAVPGTYFIKVYAEWPDGSHQHYPPADEFMKMTVTR